MTDKTPKTYDCTAALVLMAMAVASEQEPDVRKALETTTDIPADRLDFATHEISQMVEPLKAVVPVLAMLAKATGEDERKLIAETIGDAKWTDDDKRNLRVRAYMENAEAGEPPVVDIRTKLKAKSDD